MKNKFKRQEAITGYLIAGRAGSQDELLNLLRMDGFDCTQATLSRDLHEMKVVKVPDDEKGYKYTLMMAKPDVGGKNTLRIHHLSDGFRDLQFSGNTAVIRTFPGYASSIALAIDNARHPELLGTIAGDDTIFAVLKENVTKEEVKRVLEKTFPFIKNKI
jgi:transcriptional regulator of arginine metabolism